MICGTVEDGIIAVYFGRGRRVPHRPCKPRYYISLETANALRLELHLPLFFFFLFTLLMDEQSTARGKKDQNSVWHRQNASSRKCVYHIIDLYLFIFTVRRVENVREIVTRVTFLRFYRHRTIITLCVYA